ncbi:hypothetical protein GCM10022223_63940 [Kineosporia mesophila]|uniref:TetR family transcriptional regulator n=1 Tax=Kineosporia mesophila TaxID=566012 RepID=A0ABP7AMZ6_9ACTN|nr:hypothetical protein [Kineosporia mesophila]MCD5349348.1 hypothetical protein [Kineosporia mesophila]
MCLTLETDTESATYGATCTIGTHHGPGREALTAVEREMYATLVLGQGLHPRPNSIDSVATFWDFQRQHRTVMVALQQASTVDESFARRQDEMLEPDLRHIAEHLSGLDLPGDPIVAATIISRLMWSFATVPTPHTSDDEAIETLTTFIHAGLAGLGRS